MFRIKTIILSLWLINFLLVFNHGFFVFAKQTQTIKEEAGKKAIFFDKLFFTVQGELKYDTNVFNYSRDDIDEYKDYSNPNRFNQVKHIGDFITTTGIGIEFKNKLFGHTLKLGSEIEPHFYTQNKIKDYESYRFYLRQYLKRDEYLEFNYNYIPSFFLRNLYDRDYNAYRKSFFDKSLYSIGYRRELNKVLSAMLRYSYEKNDYNSNFNEYDMESNAVNLTLWYKINNYLRSKIYFEFEKVDAKGNLYDTSRVEFDPTYDKYEIGLRQAIGLIKNIDFYIQYAFSFRDYTTGNAVADDPYHADRQDKLQTIGLGLDYNFNKNAHIFFKYEYRIKDVNTAAEDPSVRDASILGYDKQVFSFRISYKF